MHQIKCVNADLTAFICSSGYNLQEVNLTMVRSRQRITIKRAESPAAARKALEGQLSVRAVGCQFDIDHVILLHCEKHTQFSQTTEVDSSVS